MIGQARVEEFRYQPHLVMQQQERVRRRFFHMAGGNTRTVARRSLKQARRIRVSELPEEAREEYESDMDDFKAGLRARPPVLRTIISKPGDPPLLQMKRSPLKYRLMFAVSSDNYAVVVGPERARTGIARDLEEGRNGIRARPFMGPAFNSTLPKLPSMLRSAVGG